MSKYDGQIDQARKMITLTTLDKKQIIYQCKTRNEDKQRDIKKSLAKQGQRHCKSVKFVIIVTGNFSTNTNPFKGGSHTVTTFLLASPNLGDEIPFKGGSL